MSKAKRRIRHSQVADLYGKNVRGVMPREVFLGLVDHRVRRAGCRRRGFYRTGKRRYRLYTSQYIVFLRDPSGLLDDHDFPRIDHATR